MIAIGGKEEIRESKEARSIFCLFVAVVAVVVIPGLMQSKMAGKRLL